jgi:hypothetical protein
MGFYIAGVMAKGEHSKPFQMLAISGSFDYFAGLPEMEISARSSTG